MENRNELVVNELLLRRVVRSIERQLVKILKIILEIIEKKLITPFVKCRVIISTRI